MQVIEKHPAFGNKIQIAITSISVVAIENVMSAVTVVLKGGGKNFFFFLCELSFTNIQESQDCRGRGREFH